MSYKFTIFKKGLILIAVPLLFQLAFIGLVAWIQQMNVEIQERASHSKVVIAHVLDLYGNLADAQTSVRGFIIAGDPIFAVPFDDAVQEVPEQLEQLRVLLQSNPDQEARARHIAAKALEVVARQAETGRLVRAGSRDQAIANVKTQAGERLMNELRQEIAAFLEAEEGLNVTRDQRLERTRQQLNWLLLAGTVAAFLSTGILAFIFSRGISGRLATLASNVQRVSQGQELALPVGGNDEIARLDRSFHDMAKELKLSEQALQKHTRILQSVLTNMGDGVVVADVQGKFLLFNPAAEKILGLGQIEATPEEWSERYGLYLPDGTTPYPPSQVPLARVIRGETVDAEELFVRHAKMLQGVWISATGRPLNDEEGMRHGGVVVFRDITERKRAEAEVRKLNQELELRVLERTEELAEANRDLEQKNQENELFVYSASHDLRSPLVNLQGFSKELSLLCTDVRAILTDHNLPPSLQERGLALVDEQMAESIHFIQSAVMRLSDIIDALLRLSRAGRVVYQFQRLDVNAIVARIVDSLSRTIAERGATVTVKDLPPVWSDPLAVEQIFANLIGNALNYLDLKRPGIIEVGAEHFTEANAANCNGELQAYYVKDNGLGIAEAYHHKVFQAFQCVHPEVAKGEGIGLAIVRRIVERHRGKVWLESTPGVGTTFFVTLPGSPMITGAKPYPVNTELLNPDKTRSNSHGKPSLDYSGSRR